MKDFMFLFRFKDGFDYKTASREEFQKEAMKWQTWTENLLKEGRLTPGNRLVQSGKVVKGKSKQVHDGPFAEGKEVVGSFCTVKARNIDEALEVAKGCPILDQDGSVEVREIKVY
ncbi:MAG TPA: YciI family protein [Candidatus Acidoferrales bacterium]|nr:YciI family protein [Candidatus Acidoferrales bacterium]